MSTSEDQEPPIDTDFEPVEDLDDAELVEQKRELGQILYDGYAPHIHDWHEEVAIRHRDIWREIRSRADTRPPECPYCGGRRWGQSPGDPVHCGECGHEGGRETEEAVHEAWSAMMDEVGGSDD